MENLTDTLKKARIVAVLAVNDPSGAVDLAKALNGKESLEALRIGAEM